MCVFPILTYANHLKVVFKNGMSIALSNFQIHLKHFYKWFFLNIHVKIKKLAIYTEGKGSMLCFTTN